MRSLIALFVLTASAALAVPCAELPVLFIVQDKSGSMNFAPDGTTATAANATNGHIALSPFHARSSADGPPPAAHGTKTRAASATAAT